MNEEQTNKSSASGAGQAGIPSDLNGGPHFADAEAAFNQLFSVIQKLADESDRERAKTNAKALQAAIESGNKLKARELVRILEESVGRIQPLIALNRGIGIPEGNIR